MGDKATGLFEKKKKETGELAETKIKNAKKLAEDQMAKTTEAISGATSGASGLVAGISNSATDKKDEVQKNAGKTKIKIIIFQI